MSKNNSERVAKIKTIKSEPLPPSLLSCTVLAALCTTSALERGRKVRTPMLLTRTSAV